mgnify:CR=1 FL=1
MHPNEVFHSDNRALCEALLHEIGFGMVYLTTPDGPCVAHTPFHSTRDGAVQFHLSNDNALTQHLDGAEPLLLVNGPHAYVSPRWYEHAGKAPTWNYVALELDGRVRTMAPEGLADLLGALAKRNESRLGGSNQWMPADMSPTDFAEMFGRITGFEMEVRQWRLTLKLSQNISQEDRERVADALGEEGSETLAQLMRTVGQ